MLGLLSLDCLSSGSMLDIGRGLWHIRFTWVLNENLQKPKDALQNPHSSACWRWKRKERTKRLHNEVNWYRQLRAGTLEVDSRTPTGVLQSFSQGGALGINLMMLELWQLVLGGFWNHIFGNQEYDPRTLSFWSLSVVKKRDQQLRLSKTRNLTSSIIRLFPLLPC